MHPRFHYAPARNWLSDPNGLVHHAGEWHLFYQYNPQGEDWGHMSWGHAVSRDLRAWEELPVALHDDARRMVFSGSAVIDRTNSAGFGADAMVAVYTAHLPGEPVRQVQHLAHSTDRGRTWREYAGNPVLDRDMADFRDPNAFWHEDTARWIMVLALSAENRAEIYASPDLRQWECLSEIPTGGAPGHLWECPLLIALPTEEGGSRWMFKVDVLSGAPGSGALYQTGSFDGVSFLPDGEGWKTVDHGADFYAAIAWHEPRDERGRPVWIGWMGNHAYQGALPAKGWRGAMSMPRRIWLRSRAEGHVLCQEPVVAGPDALPEVSPADGPVPLACHIRLPGAEWRWSIADGDGRSIELERRDGVLRVRREDARCPALDRVCEAPLAGVDPLDLWLDAGSLEVVGAGGGFSLTLQHGILAGTPMARFERAGPA